MTLFPEMKDIDWRTYETFMTIEAFEKFWKETERLINDAAKTEELSEGPKWTPETDQEISEYQAERDLARYDGVPIEIQPLFIERSIQAINKFFNELFLKVGWKVNEKWLIK